MKATSINLNRSYSGKWIMAFTLDERSVQEAIRFMNDKVNDSEPRTWDVSIKEHHESRSRSANAYFHVLCQKLANALNTDSMSIKQEMVLRYGTAADAAITLPNGVQADRYYPYCKWLFGDEKKDTYLLYKQTHTLDSKEFSVLLSGVIDECRQIGVETLSDEELENLYAQADKKHIHIQRDKAESL